MQTGNVCFYPGLALIAGQRFIARQVVALPDVVHQFLHQYRREALAVVLNGAANVADVERLLC